MSQGIFGALTFGGVPERASEQGLDSGYFSIGCVILGSSPPVCGGNSNISLTAVR